MDYENEYKTLCKQLKKRLRCSCARSALEAYVLLMDTMSTPKSIRYGGLEGYETVKKIWFEVEHAFPLRTKEEKTWVAYAIDKIVAEANDNPSVIDELLYEDEGKFE